MEIDIFRVQSVTHVTDTRPRLDADTNTETIKVTRLAIPEPSCELQSTRAKDMESRSHRMKVIT